MTRDRFPRAFDLLKVHEGGYSNHPDDPGGATMKGVTQRTYNGYRNRLGLGERHVKKITDEEVEQIYREQYWDTVKGDDLPPGLAYCVFDAAVNSGPARAARWLQELLGIPRDGIIGNETLGAIKGLSTRQLINDYCDKRLAFMKSLSHWGSFKNGWTKRVEEVRNQSVRWSENYVPPPSVEPPQPKAEGKRKESEVFRDIVGQRGALGAIGGILGSTGALVSGDGPVQYALAAVLVIGALVGVWWLVRNLAK